MTAPTWHAMAACLPWPSFADQPHADREPICGACPVRRACWTSDPELEYGAKASWGQRWPGDVGRCVHDLTAASARLANGRCRECVSAENRRAYMRRARRGAMA